MLKAGRHPLAPARFQQVRTPEESTALNRMTHSVIIISASGMATGGRILHHLKARLPDPTTTVLLVGFQAEGTRGRALQDGAAEVKIQGSVVPVKAKIVALDGLSAHADRDEILRWLAGFARPPRQTYIVHGEPVQADSLARTIYARLGWRVRVARDRETVPLDR